MLKFYWLYEDYMLPFYWMYILIYHEVFIICLYRELVSISAELCLIVQLLLRNKSTIQVYDNKVVSYAQIVLKLKLILTYCTNFTLKNCDKHSLKSQSLSVFEIRLNFSSILEQQPTPMKSSIYRHGTCNNKP